MLVAASSSFAVWENCRTLGHMADGDVEEGEISDAASVEEICEDDFNKEAKNSKEFKQVVASGSDGAGVGGGDSRVWTLRDLWNNYPGFRGYAASGLCNLAWAQAVQNKPLDHVLLKDVESDEALKRSSRNEDDKIVIDDSEGEKEEGELEEGEIDLDSEPVESNLSGEANLGSRRRDVANVDGVEVDTKYKELENKVKFILGVLEITTVIETEKSIEGVCSRVMDALESLRELVLGNDKVPKRDTLVQLSFTALETIYSVFYSMDIRTKEQHKEIVSRLLSLAKSQFSSLFSQSQMKEVEIMIQFVTSEMDVRAGTTDKEKEGRIMGVIYNERDNNSLIGDIDPVLTCAIRPSIAPEPFRINEPSMSSEALKQGTSSLRSRAPLLPLLDLHKDHDADSLPSPTRETTQCLLVNMTGPVGSGQVQPGFATEKVAEDSKMHPYVTDAVKAVSSYQQKFGRSSVFSSDRLPSPTPSEESGDSNGNLREEDSSSSTVNNSILVNSPILGPPVSHPSIVNFTPRNTVPMNSVSTPAMRPSAKSRDPRLRFANVDEAFVDADRHFSQSMHNSHKADLTGSFMSSRKQKSIEGPSIEGPALKRQKNGLQEAQDPRSMQKVSGSCGWLEDIDMVVRRSQTMHGAESNPRKIDNGVSCSAPASGPPSVTAGLGFGLAEPVSIASTNSTVSLSEVLKDIAVNPTMLLNFLKMGEKQKQPEIAQKRPTDPRKAIQQPSSSNSMLGVVTVSSPNPSGLQIPEGKLQVPSHVVPLDESTKVCMKPRDPRRILHGNTLQRSETVVEDQFKASGPMPSGIRCAKDRPVEMKPLHSQLVLPPEFDKQLTNNLKNMADILAGKEPDTAQQFNSLRNIPNLVSVSRVTNLPAVSQDVPPQVGQTNVEIDAKSSRAGDQQRRIDSAPKVDEPAPSHPPNAWGDVEHLFDGYDDKQKAAIQRERSRRLEEQKKMFAAHKLCLVLDLDHTLLNSAKFIEVDPVHDEILRKKEEQDREKPQRHLFRLPHMGMWTKLRPGIWNFLEKASKLYELHLYTMGNKLYATEMAKVLDPKGTLFNGRVISRGDDGDPFDGDERIPKSKDLEGVLGMESAVVIIDDSVRVWPHNKMNLIVVERYTYFPCSRRQFGLLGPSLLEIDHDERPEDGTLASSLAVIERIHHNFFAHPSLHDVDVRNILAAEQQKILSGCRIVFSRVFPVGEVNPHLHPLWQTAEQFGAVCTTQIDENVTHVVANSLGTDKVNWALSKGRFVVHPGWVEASALLYRKANEHDFAIKP